MIVAYHKGTIVYAYKGIFNYNIDHAYDWNGGVLVSGLHISHLAHNKNIGNVATCIEDSEQQAMYTCV